MTNRSIYHIFFMCIILFLFGCAREVSDNKYNEWYEYLGGPDRNHYTEISQISPENVHKLKVEWAYSLPDSGQMQMNPIIKNGLVYGVSPRIQAFALDAKTGEEVWFFGDTINSPLSTSRGVSYWEKGEDKRVLYTVGSELYALNALTGRPILEFGTKGKIDLHEGLPEIAKDKFVISNTPGTIFKDLIVMPVRVGEGEGAAPGDIRAYSVLTGDLMWTFHTIPYPGEFGYESWEDRETYKNEYIGGANNWSGMAVDIKREILYVPTGSAAPDFYGGKRKGNNLFANCLLALDANSGKLLWHYQLTHHDIWDRDPPAPPNLISVKRNGKLIDAVAQITKQGYVFVFDRVTGEPLFDIDEVEVPLSKLEGEEASFTQPVPKLPKPFARQSNEITEADISRYSTNRDELISEFRNLETALYNPPGIVPSLLLPGYDGGAEWGGAGADPEKGIIYINSNEMPWVLEMEKSEAISGNGTVNGSDLYDMHCAVCHQKNLSGRPKSGYPSLVGLSSRLSEEDVLNILNSGKAMMPGFSHLSIQERESILAFIYRGDKIEVIEDYVNSTNQMPYKHKGYFKFLDSNGLPAINPPWGTLSAIDLNSGEFLWQIPLGVTEELRDENTGTENYGGPIITKNGLLFIAATKDGYFRAFNRNNGKLLWETKLPAASFATPSTYMIDGKQYIVLACGGEKLQTAKGNQIITFAIENE